MAKFKVGDRVEVLQSDTGKGPGHYVEGQICTVLEASEGSYVATINDQGGRNGWIEEYFKLYEGVKMSTAKRQYKLGDSVDLSNTLVPISHEAHNNFNEGDLFVVVNKDESGYSSILKNGQVIQFHSNDGSRNPYFFYTESDKANESYYSTYWKALAPLPLGKTAKVQKPVVASTRTVYSDGVEVSEDEIKFDGTTHKREDLKKLVARYQEVLRRPVASVATVKKTVKKAKK